MTFDLASRSNESQIQQQQGTDTARNNFSQDRTSDGGKVELA